MAEKGFKRKLTAIFSADVAGYSRLMGDDEAATVATLEAYKQVMVASIKEHRGRVIDSPGDNLLAEFASVVDAVQCAVAVQKELQVRNESLPENRRMYFRIGINLGDVIEEQGRIYGDGVNIAARLEALAEPGGICISKTVFDHIETKLPLGYEYLGEQVVKNIARPVPAYKVLMEPRVSVGRKGLRRPKAGLLWRHPVMAGAILVCLLVGAGFGVWMFSRGVPEQKQPSGGKVAASLLDEKSIAVMPLTNLSGDPGQEYLSDGLSEDLITALSALPHVRVIARNSTFVYKGKPVNVQQVGKELGVRYVLEGSIMTDAGRVRITAQLIDTDTGSHVWAERYDREMKDIFALQDEITLNIVRALQVKIGPADRHVTLRRAPESLDAYLKLLKGKGHFASSTRGDNEKARQLFEEAVQLDPDYPTGYLLLARTYLREVWLGWSRDSRLSLQKALDLAEKALTLDPSDGNVHALLSQVYLFQGLHEKAMEEAESALSLAPSSVDCYMSLGLSLYFAGQYGEAVRAYKEAMRLDPNPPAGLLYQMGNAYLMGGYYKEAEDAFRQALVRNPKNMWAHVGMAAMYSMLGQEKEAREAAEKVLSTNPSFSLKNLEDISPYRDPSEKERLMGALRKAGLS